MSNTNRVDKNLFQDAHYLGKPADHTDLIISRRIRLLYQIPEFFNHNLSCIEIGCGSGATITRVAKEFNTALGIDIFDYAASFEEEKKLNHASNVSFQQVDLEKEIPAVQFDRIISFEVIEHFEKEATVAAYLKLLKPGGIAAISVPNKWWIFETHGAKLPLLPWNRVPFFSWLPRPLHERWAHARIYTRQRIVQLLQKHGFEIEYTQYITAPMDVLKEGKLKSWLQKYIFKNDTTPNPFLSTAIFVVAKKPL